MTLEFAGKVALVSAAGRGIGRASALAFAKLGAAVMVSDIDEAGGMETVELIRASGNTAEFLAADVTQEEAVQALITQTVELLGGLDFAHNNAGAAFGSQTFGDFGLDDWNRTLALSLTSAWLCMRAEIPVMIERGGGAIVNTASMAGVRFAENANAAYSAAKAGVINPSENAAARYAKQGVRVNSIAPGLTHTPVIDELFTPEQQQQMAAAIHLIERMVEPEDIAEAVTFLCSQRAAMITGVMIPICGGQNVKG